MQKHVRAEAALTRTLPNGNDVQAVTFSLSVCLSAVVWLVKRCPVLLPCVPQQSPGCRCWENYRSCESSPPSVGRGMGRSPPPPPKKKGNRGREQGKGGKDRLSEKVWLFKVTPPFRFQSKKFLFSSREGRFILFLFSFRLLFLPAPREGKR